MTTLPEQRLYIQRIVKSELEGAMVSRPALFVLDALTALAAGRLTGNASNYVTQGGRVTMRQQHVEAAVRMISDGDLSREALEVIHRAVATYEKNRQVTDPSVSKTQAAGLILSTPRVDRSIRAGMTCRNLGEKATIAMTAALETVVRHLVRKAVEAASSDRKRKKITPRYIMLAIHQDPDLRILFKGARIGGAGVVPRPKRKRQTKKKKKRPMKRAKR